METTDIRDKVAQEAPKSSAIWPNGLGFTWYGIEYVFSDKGNWVAWKDRWTIGHGETWQEARDSMVRIE